MEQRSLFGSGDEPHIGSDLRTTLERIPLEHGAWLDVARGWLRGHERLYDLLRERVQWRSENRVMYDQTVEVPRQYGVLDPALPLHPVLATMRSALDRHYQTSFDRCSVALYRDGRDSVAWHGDYVARRMREALVATISVGQPRRFLIRPTGGGTSLTLSLGWGDLLVMGGSCQRTYQHAIPKVAHADPRVAIMFRPVWKEEDPDAPPTQEQASGRGPG